MPYPKPSAQALVVRATKPGHAIEYLHPDADLAGLIIKMTRLKVAAYGNGGTMTSISGPNFASKFGDVMTAWD